MNDEKGLCESLVLHLGLVAQILYLFLKLTSHLTRGKLWPKPGNLDRVTYVWGGYHLCSDPSCIINSDLADKSSTVVNGESVMLHLMNNWLFNTLPWTDKK